MQTGLLRLGLAQPLPTARAVVLCSESSRTRFQLFPALVFSNARPKDRRACAPPQTHFPWKLTGEISFDDIAAAGGPPDQWDALPTNAKLQIILFIGPRIHRRTVISARALLWHTGAARTVLLVEIEDDYESR